MLSFVAITIGHSAIDNKDSYYKDYDGDRNHDGDDNKDFDEDGIVIIACVYWATSIITISIITGRQARNS